MLEAAERGALLRQGVRIVDVDLDDPAEAIGLVRLLRDVEAVVEGGPFVGAFRDTDPLVVGRLRMTGGKLAREITVKVLLGQDVGAPWGDAAGTVVDRAEDFRAGRVGAGLQARIAGSGAGDLHFRAGGDAAVHLAIGNDLPFAVRLADFDDGAAMCSHLDVDLRLRQRRDLGGLLALLVDDRDDAGEHQMRIGVFVVDHQQAMLGRAVDRDVADIVVVVAELLCLGFRRLIERVEGRRIGESCRPGLLHAEGPRIPLGMRIIVVHHFWIQRSRVDGSSSRCQPAKAAAT